MANHIFSFESLNQIDTWFSFKNRFV